MTKTPNAAEFNQPTPLHTASLFGYTDIVEFLVTIIEDPNVRNGRRAPIDIARDHGHIEIVRILQAYE